jgi:hypothetical protein
MSRLQKMHKPLKGNFTQIINAIADGKGVKQPLQARNAARPQNIVKATQQQLKKP